MKNSRCTEAVAMIERLNQTYEQKRISGNAEKASLPVRMHEGKVAAHVRYYEDYIQAQVRGGRSEQEVLAELGDPRLIARTLLDTDPDTGQENYEEYSTYTDGEVDRQQSAGKHVHVWRFDTWYSKLLAW